MFRTLFGLLQPGAGRNGAYEDAIAELSAYSDRELADLGITRGQIRDAVYHGRAGIDTPTVGTPANQDDRPAARTVRAA